MTTGIRTFGIDVSHYNDVIDWNKALGGIPGKIHYCYAKASQLYFDKAGKLVKQHDAQFDRNWRELARLGLPRGAYHYCMPEFTAQDMADWFFTVYTPTKGDLIPSLDVEDEYVRSIAQGKKTRVQLVDQILEFASLVEAKIVRKPLIYIRSDITQALGNPAAFEQYPLWIAQYTAAPTVPDIPKPWNDYALWQYSESGKWTGIPGDTDLNFMNGDSTQIANYTIG